MERSPAVPMATVCPAPGPMRATEFRGFERQDVVCVLEQDGGVFGGLLDGGGVGFYGVYRGFLGPDWPGVGWSR
jgi:hypothetical protein